MIKHIEGGKEDREGLAKELWPVGEEDGLRPDSTPDSLLASIRGEDGLQGLEMLHKKYYLVLCNYACRFVSSTEAAEDIVSDVFFKLWRDREELEVKASCRAYLFTAVKNRAYNYLGREYRQHQSLDSPAVYLRACDDNPEKSLVYKELAVQIESAISALPPQCHRVFMLSRYEGLKYKDIALRLNISRKAVEANMGRALKSLRYLLGFYQLFLSFVYLFRH